MGTKNASKNELLSLMNVGKATHRDLEILDIGSIQELSKADPDELYVRLQHKTGRVQDPCVWDIFAAIIHEAKTGEKTPWWKWTPIRKQRSRNNNFQI